MNRRLGWNNEGRSVVVGTLVAGSFFALLSVWCLFGDYWGVYHWAFLNAPIAIVAIEGWGVSSWGIAAITAANSIAWGLAAAAFVAIPIRRVFLKHRGLHEQIAGSARSGVRWMGIAGVILVVVQGGGWAGLYLCRGRVVDESSSIRSNLDREYICDRTMWVCESTLEIIPDVASPCDPSTGNTAGSGPAREWNDPWTALPRRSRFAIMRLIRRGVPGRGGAYELTIEIRSYPFRGRRFTIAPDVIMSRQRDGGWKLREFVLPVR